MSELWQRSARGMVAFTLLCSAGISASGQVPGYAARWRFNERFGQAVYDDSGNTNTGTIENAARALGYEDTGLMFNGVNAGVRVPSSNSLRATDGLTISAWIHGGDYFTPLNGYKMIARKGSSYFFAIQGNRVYGRVNTGGAWRPVAGATYLNPNAWTHVAMTFDRTDRGYPGTLSDFTGMRTHPANPMVRRGEPGEFDQNLREIGNILYEPDHPDPNKRYKIFYTGWAGTQYQQNITHIGMAYSPDGVTWTKFGNIIPWRALEDPYAVKVDGVYYLFAEDKEDVPFRNVRRFHSLDCETWIDDGDVFDTQPGGNPPYWEGQDVSSIAVYVENGVWYMYYEGRGTGKAYIGLCTSLDGLVWTRWSLDPLILTGPLGSWDDNIVCPDDLIKIGDTYYFFYHGSGSATRNLSRAGLFTSTDLYNWTRYENNPIANTDGCVTLVDPSGISFFQIHGDLNISRWEPFVVNSPRLFVNGVEEPYLIREHAFNLPIVVDNQDFAIGKTPVGQPLFPFNGSIDDVLVYRRALTPVEIEQIFFTSNQPTPESNDDAGAPLEDETPPDKLFP